MLCQTYNIAMEDHEIVDKIRQLVKDSPLSYFSQIFSNKNSELRDYVLLHSRFLDGKLDSVHNKPYAKSTRVVYALNNLLDYPKCKTCGKPIARNIACYEDISNLYCCNKCAQKDPSTIAKGKATKLQKYGDPNYNNKDKAKKTCNDRYGVDYAWQSDVTKKASKDTMMKHYGVDHHMKSSAFKEEMRRRYKDLHGVEHPFQDPIVIEKICSANQKNFGVDYPMQSKELRKVMHENSIKTQKKNYFNDVVCKDAYVEPMFGVDEWVKFAGITHEHEFLWRCKKCGKEFKHKVMYGSPLFARCYDCYPIISSTSNFEKEIVSFLNSLGNGIIAVNREDENKNLIPPQEIDIIVKKDDKIKLLIEADGLFWHSIQCRKDKYYHLDKTQRCEKLGYQLIHVFEDEWNTKNEIVKSRLKNLLGIYGETIYARKCEVKALASKESKDFFNTTHIQGNTQSSIRYGLFYGGSLVAAMSFGHRRKITNAKRIDGEYELLRFSTKIGCHVIGGAGKLLAHFERTQKDLKTLLSYADMRWSAGKLYGALGFTLDHISEPNYWYMDSHCSHRMYRYAFRKSILPKMLKSFDKDKTEMENMVANGFNVIWDCGNYVFVKRY